jgi:hypothetical protein
LFSSILVLPYVLSLWGCSLLSWFFQTQISHNPRRWRNCERRFIRRYTFQWMLANGSFDVLGYLYPLHSPIWGC